jgi:hypothetical protein
VEDAMKFAVFSLVLAASLQGQNLPSRDKGRDTLYFFLSRESPGIASLSRDVVQAVLERKGGVRLRPVLLVEDFQTLGKIDDRHPFFKSLKELGRLYGKELDISVYDDEGLRLAREWKVTRLPALVLVQGRTAHKVSGSAVNVGRLLEVKE